MQLNVTLAKGDDNYKALVSQINDFLKFSGKGNIVLDNPHHWIIKYPLLPWVDVRVTYVLLDNRDYFFIDKISRAEEERTYAYIFCPDLEIVQIWKDNS